MEFGKSASTRAQGRRLGGLFSFFAPRRKRPVNAGVETDVRMSDSLERELIEREMRRMNGF